MGIYKRFGDVFHATRPKWSNDTFDKQFKNNICSN